ncbi:hypothetical protein CSA17_02525 [bacterium DOLJORAL78_65_58]|nr:MAG: hypothetical protein CSA17_02525 [bacterium DOLJORAL78_65_58]
MNMPTRWMAGTRVFGFGGNRRLLGIQASGGITMSSSRTSLTFFLVFFILILNHGAALAEVIHPGETYAESVTWTNIDPVHVVTGNITVGGDATLTIQPGCLVKFESGATISIYGNLQAVGTSGLGITFTSREADGAWSGLRFLSEAIGTLEHCTIERATQGGGGVSIAGADVGIASCLFRNNDYGIYYSITDNVNLSAANTFTDNIFGGVYFSVCANPYVDNQTITGTTGSWGGLFFHETSNFVVGANNTITGNIWAVGMTLSSAPSPLSAGHIPTSGNTNNDGLWVRGGTQDNDYTWPDLGVPYIITYNGTVGPEATLDIAAGASLLFEDFVTLNIYGALNGNGTVADPVLFSRRNEAAAPPAGWSTASSSTPRMDCISARRRWSSRTACCGTTTTASTTTRPPARIWRRPTPSRTMLWPGCASASAPIRTSTTRPSPAGRTTWARSSSATPPASG